MSKDLLEQYRADLDEIDKQLTHLLIQRFSLSQLIGEYKTKNQVPLHDLQREEAILLQTTTQIPTDKLQYKDSILSVMRNVLSTSLSLMRLKKR